MQIDPAEFWKSQQTRRNDLPIGDDHDGIWRERFEYRLKFWSTNFLWLMDWNARLHRDLFHGCLRNFLPAALGAVWLGDDCGDFDFTLCEQRLQRGNCELRCAAKNQAQITTRLAFSFF
jgi:hypothetical protein